MADHDQVAVVEHFKDYVREIIQAYSDGSQGATMGVVVTELWRKADELVQAVKPEALRGTLRLRVAQAASAIAPPPTPPGLISCRCIGAKDEAGDDVYYIVVAVADYEKAIETIGGLQAREFKVRDWEYYA